MIGEAGAGTVAQGEPSENDGEDRLLETKDAGVTRDAEDQRQGRPVAPASEIGSLVYPNS